MTLQLVKRRARVVGVEMFNKCFLDLPGDNCGLLFDPSVKLTDIQPGDVIRGVPKEKQDEPGQVPAVR